MAIFLLSLNAPSAQPQRTFSGVLVVAVIDRAFSGLLATAITERLQTFSGLYVRAATLDANNVPLPPPLNPVAGYVVTHQGLPMEAVGYSISARENEAAPRLEATLRGRVVLGGTVMIIVALRREDEILKQVYGPFGALGYTHTQTPTGWITTLSSADMSAADTEADSPLMPIFEEEFLPWERERDLTPLEQAQQARDEALSQRQLRQRQASQERDLQRQLARPGVGKVQREIIRAQLKALRKQIKPAPDRRKVPVQDVLTYALAALPIPFILGGPLPYGGDFFWAEADTGAAFMGGILIGVSFQIKGKTPLSVLQELLSPVGYQVVIRFGAAYIGPPEALEDAAQTPGYLDLPTEMLTGLSIEAVNPEASLGGGNRQLPRRITLTGASARLYLPPLPPETDGQGGVINPSDLGQTSDGRLTTESFTYGKHVDTGESGLQSHTTSTVEKADGVLVEEVSRTLGFVPLPGYSLNKSLSGEYSVSTVKWALREERITTHVYGAGADYPRAEVWSHSIARAYVGFLGREAVTEETTVRQTWHEEGWLVEKITEKTVYDNFALTLGADALGNPAAVPVSLANHEDERERWTPINEQTWLHEVKKYQSSWITVVGEGGEPESAIRGGVNAYWSEMTDQGPPRAPQEEDAVDPDSPEVGDGFPYEKALQVILEPGGRGDPVTRSAPWATTLDAGWTEDIVGTIRRARTSQRTRYELAAPPRIGIGTRIKDFSLTGKAGSVRASVTVEEALNVP